MRRPRRWASTAPSCSTNTRVLPPTTVISGRKEAGRALREVGATTTTDRGSSASDCTTTPYLSPCCSCPTPLGSLKRWTSPRCTHRLHQRRNGDHLGPVGVVRLQCRNLGDQLTARTHPGCRCQQRRPDGLGSAEAGRLHHPERSLCVVVESDRDRLRHDPSMTERDTVDNPRVERTLPDHAGPRTRPIGSSPLPDVVRHAVRPPPESLHRYHQQLNGRRELRAAASLHASRKETRRLATARTRPRCSIWRPHGRAPIGRSVRARLHGLLVRDWAWSLADDREHVHRGARSTVGRDRLVLPSRA